MGRLRGVAYQMAAGGAGTKTEMSTVASSAAPSSAGVGASGADTSLAASHGVNDLSTAVCSIFAMPRVISVRVRRRCWAQSPHERTAEASSARHSTWFAATKLWP